MDWIEANNQAPDGYEISTTVLRDYLDRHIDVTGTFEKFVDDR